MVVCILGKVSGRSEWHGGYMQSKMPHRLALTVTDMPRPESLLKVSMLGGPELAIDGATFDRSRRLGILRDG